MDNPVGQNFSNPNNYPAPSMPYPVSLELPTSYATTYLLLAATGLATAAYITKGRFAYLAMAMTGLLCSIASIFQQKIASNAYKQIIEHGQQISIHHSQEINKLWQAFQEQKQNNKEELSTLKTSFAKEIQALNSKIEELQRPQQPVVAKPLPQTHNQPIKVNIEQSQRINNSANTIIHYEEPELLNKEDVQYIQSKMHRFCQDHISSIGQQYKQSVFTALGTYHQKLGSLAQDCEQAKSNGGFRVVTDRYGTTKKVDVDTKTADETKEIVGQQMKLVSSLKTEYSFELCTPNSPKLEGFTDRIKQITGSIRIDLVKINSNGQEIDIIPIIKRALKQMTYAKLILSLLPARNITSKHVQEIENLRQALDELIANCNALQPTSASFQIKAASLTSDCQSKFAKITNQWEESLTNLEAKINSQYQLDEPRITVEVQKVSTDWGQIYRIVSHWREVSKEKVWAPHYDRDSSYAHDAACNQKMQNAHTKYENSVKPWLIYNSHLTQKSTVGDCKNELNLLSGLLQSSATTPALPSTGNITIEEVGNTPAEEAQVTDNVASNKKSTDTEPNERKQNLLTTNQIKPEKKSAELKEGSQKKIDGYQNNIADMMRFNDIQQKELKKCRSRRSKPTPQDQS